MDTLKFYLSDEEIEIVAKSLGATVEDVREYDSFGIEYLFEDVLSALYGDDEDTTYEYNEEEFVNSMNNVFKFECGYLIIW